MRVFVCYTLLETLNVPEGATEEEIEKFIREDMEEKNIYDFVNDVEYTVDK
jgi:hypothetical protein